MPTKQLSLIPEENLPPKQNGVRQWLPYPNDWCNNNSLETTTKTPFDALIEQARYVHTFIEQARQSFSIRVTQCDQDLLDPLWSNEVTAEERERKKRMSAKYKRNFQYCIYIGRMLNSLIRLTAVGSPGRDANFLHALSSVAEGQLDVTRSAATTPNVNRKVANIILMGVKRRQAPLESIPLSVLVRNSRFIEPTLNHNDIKQAIHRLVDKGVLEKMARRGFYRLTDITHLESIQSYQRA